MKKRLKINYGSLEKFNYKKYYENDYERGFYNLDRSKEKWFSKYVKIKIIEKWLKKYKVNKEILLDVGGGTGTYAWHFMNDFKHTIVSDISKTALKLIPEKEIRKINCNILHHPLEAKSVDIILLIDVFEHIKEQELENLMKEMNRLLKKNSHIIIYSSLYGWGRGSIYNRMFNIKRHLYIGEEEMGHLNRLTFKEYKGLFKKTNFKILDYLYYSVFFQPVTDFIKDKSADFLENFWFKKRNKEKNWSSQRKGQDFKEKLREKNKSIIIKSILYLFSWISYLDILIFGKVLKGNSIFFILEKQ